MSIWFSGIILASVVRGREFDSRNTPKPLLFRDGLVQSGPRSKTVGPDGVGRTD